MEKQDKVEKPSKHLHRHGEWRRAVWAAGGMAVAQRAAAQGCVCSSHRVSLPRAALSMPHCPVRLTLCWGCIFNCILCIFQVRTTISDWQWSVWYPENAVDTEVDKTSQE